MGPHVDMQNSEIKSSLSSPQNELNLINGGYISDSASERDPNITETKYMVQVTKLDGLHNGEKHKERIHLPAKDSGSSLGGSPPSKTPSTGSANAEVFSFEFSLPGTDVASASSPSSAPASSSTSGVKSSSVSFPVVGKPPVTPPRSTPAEFRRSLSSPATSSMAGQGHVQSHQVHMKDISKDGIVLSAERSQKDVRRGTSPSTMKTSGATSFSNSVNTNLAAPVSPVLRPVACRITRHAPSASAAPAGNFPAASGNHLPAGTKTSATEAENTTQLSSGAARLFDARIRAGNIPHRAASSSPVSRRRRGEFPALHSQGPHSQNLQDFGLDFLQLKDGSTSPLFLKGLPQDPSVLDSKGVHSSARNMASDSQQRIGAYPKTAEGQFLPGKPPLPVVNGTQAVGDCESIYDVPWNGSSPAASKHLQNNVLNKSQSLKELNGEVCASFVHLC